MIDKETGSEQLEGLKRGEEVPLSDNIEITELHCHNCDGYIRFALDKGKSGQHVLICPNCKHEHCRVIQNGKVTGDRWSSRNGDIGLAATATYIITPSMDNFSMSGWQTVPAGIDKDQFLNDSWGNTSNVANNVMSGTTYYATVTATASVSFTMGNWGTAS